MDTKSKIAVMAAKKQLALQELIRLQNILK